MRDKIKLLRFRHLNGWQKLIGVLAVVMALLIILNPEFLVLGLMSDTVFFEMLVFALSLHLRQLAVRGFHSCVGLLSRGMHWLIRPTPIMLYCLAIVTPVLAGAVALLQRAFNSSRS
jgi:hypothetical protein